MLLVCVCGGGEFCVRQSAEFETGGSLPRPFSFSLVRLSPTPLSRPPRSGGHRFACLFALSLFLSPSLPLSRFLPHLSSPCDVDDKLSTHRRRWTICPQNKLKWLLRIRGLLLNLSSPCLEEEKRNRIRDEEGGGTDPLFSSSLTKPWPLIGWLWWHVIPGDFSFWGTFIFYSIMIVIVFNSIV